MNRPILVLCAVTMLLVGACSAGGLLDVTTSSGGGAGTGGAAADAGADALPSPCAAQEPTCPTAPHGSVCRLIPGGPCDVLVCDHGWNDCDGNIFPNGCETNVDSDQLNCGACDHACSPTVGSCVQGGCK